jgi:hypothetical protein
MWNLSQLFIVGILGKYYLATQFVGKAEFELLFMMALKHNLGGR